MELQNSKWMTAAVLFLAIFFFGYWLRSNGKPYNGLLFNIHKLLGLGALVLLILLALNLHKVNPLSSLEIAVVVTTGVLFVVMFVSGGLMSAMAAVPGYVTLAHQVLAYLTVLSTAATLYLLLILKPV